MQTRDQTGPAGDARQEAGEPLFSVIINNYNYRAFLAEAVASIEAQRFASYELIVVDDGSSDGSIAYLESLGSRCTLIRTHRAGQARACLEAVKAARGRYLYILDADDLAAPNLLATAAQFIESSPAKIQFQLTPIDAVGRPFAEPYPLLRPEMDSRHQQAEIHRTGSVTSPPTSGNIFRRDVIEAVPDIDYETAIDGVTLLYAPFAGPVVSLPVPLGAYRVHAQGHSSHADPLNGDRVRRDRARFAERLEHLNRLLSARGDARPVAGARDRFTDWDYRILEDLVAGRRPNPIIALRCVLSLLREHGFGSFAVRKLLWLAAVTVAPRTFRLRLTGERLNPWRRRATRAPATLGYLPADAEA